MGAITSRANRQLRTPSCIIIQNDKRDEHKHTKRRGKGNKRRTIKATKKQPNVRHANDRTDIQRGYGANNAAI